VKVGGIQGKVKRDQIYLGVFLLLDTNLSVVDAAKLIGTEWNALNESNKLVRYCDEELEIEAFLFRATKQKLLQSRLSMMLKSLLFLKNYLTVKRLPCPCFVCPIVKALVAGICPRSKSLFSPNSPKLKPARDVGCLFPNT
jgi:hypothetical protein